MFWPLEGFHSKLRGISVILVQLVNFYDLDIPVLLWEIYTGNKLILSFIRVRPHDLFICDPDDEHSVIRRYSKLDIYKHSVIRQGVIFF